MASLRALTLAALKSRLTGVHCFDSRVDALAPEELPAVVVETAAIELVPRGCGDYWYTRRESVNVDAFCAAVTGGATARDALLEAVTGVLLHSPTLAQTLQTAPEIGITLAVLPAGDTNLLAGRVALRGEWSEQFMVDDVNPFLAPPVGPAPFDVFALRALLESLEGHPAGAASDDAMTVEVPAPPDLFSDEYLEKDAKIDSSALVR